MTPWTTAYQAPPSMGFSRQEYWSGLHCLLQQYLWSVPNFQTDGWVLFLFLAEFVFSDVSKSILHELGSHLSVCPFYLISISQNSKPQRIPSGLSLQTYWALYTTTLGLVPVSLSPKVSHRLQEHWTMISGICPFHWQVCPILSFRLILLRSIGRVFLKSQHLSRFLNENSA